MNDNGFMTPEEMKKKLGLIFLKSWEVACI